MSRRKSEGGSPYRDGPSEGGVAPAEDAGLVGDLIRQFADPLAFYRELVQNAIDAGATKILAQITFDEETVRVSVRDDGTGMTRATLEEDLTVLFRSSKENRDDAIGKFGIGFVSVLAVSPEVVIVDTSVGDGNRFSLHLHPDQTFDLYRAAAPAEDRGTTVTLHVPTPTEGRAAFVTKSEAALRRWCRHARVPIRLMALEPGASEPTRDTRIDEPLGLDAIVAVQGTSRDGATLVVAGLPRPGERYGAFYNRGLLLYETRDHGLGEIAFKVIDSRLEHTLSRDDVRRDEGYAHAMSLVAATIRGPLLERVSEEIARAADAYARGGEEAGARLVELLGALARSGLELSPDASSVPIVTATGGSVARLSSLSAPQPVSWQGRTPLAEALARSGRTVVDLGFALEGDRASGSPTDRGDAAAIALQWIHVAPQPISDHWTLVSPVPLDDRDRALLDRVGHLLAKVARKPSLVLADVHGRGTGRLAFAAGSPGDPWLVELPALDADPFRLLARPTLVVRASHSLVESARARFDESPALAATLLARSILVAVNALTPSSDHALTELGLRSALGAEP